MSNHQSAHDNHTVPQFYLHAWGNEKNEVNCYQLYRHHEKQRVWTSQPIKSASVWRDIYTQEINGEDNDSIEHLLGEYEARASQAIEKVIATGNATDADMEILVDFAIVQMIRTPKWLMEQNEVLAQSVISAEEETVRKLLQEAATGTLVSAVQQEAPQPVDTPFPPPPIDIALDDIRNAIVTTFPVGQRSALYAMGRVLNGDVAKVLRSYSWSLFKTPIGIELPTSDNPFVRLKLFANGTYTTRCGVGVTGTLLFMPITPELLLVTRVGCKKVDTGLLYNLSMGKVLTRAIVDNAYRYVYSRKRDEEIEAMRTSIVDPELIREFERIKREWLGT